MTNFGFSQRQWRSLVRFAGLFSLCAALIIGCAGPNDTATDGTADDASSSDGAAATGGGRITMGTTQKVRTLDPADSYEIFPGILLYNMGDRLYTYETGGTELVPQLATELPTISEDGLTYTIPLREGVTFHDGSPFNAEVMAFSIQRFMENGGRPSFLLSEKIESVEATGDNELTITLNSPFAAFTALLTFWGTTPVPMDSYTIEEGTFQPDSFIGTGPYQLSELSPDTVRLDVFEDYWGDAPDNGGFDIQLFTSPANLYNAFRTQDIDIAYQTLDPDQIASLEEEASDGGWQVVEAGTTVINYMMLNQNQAPLDDVKVRQAIAALIDRPLINERVFKGQSEPLYSLIPTSFDIYKPVFKEEYGDGSTEQARELLEEAGYSEDNPLELELWYPSSSTDRNLVATTLEASFEQQLPGLIDVQVNDVESATAWPNLDKGIYPTFLLNWYPDFYDADTFIQPFMECKTGSPETGCEEGANRSFYYSDRANDLIEKQRAETDPEVRGEYFVALQDILAEDVPYIPLWQNKDFVFAQDGIENVSVEPTQQFLLWKIGKS
ncbi:MAG: ABC transporter substrate-binding protein [Elainellaceae cyanobacterium]